MLLAIPTVTIVLLIVTAILLAITIALYFLGKKAQKRQDEQAEQMAAVSQNVSMLIIDKKYLRLKESGLPEQMINQVPWYSRRAKLPIVKAKVGPQIMTLIADGAIFEDLPVKKEVKAKVSGIYITSVSGLHGKIKKDDEVKKKGFRSWLLRKQKEYSGK